MLRPVFFVLALAYISPGIKDAINKTSSSSFIRLEDEAPPSNFRALSKG